MNKILRARTQLKFLMSVQTKRSFQSGKFDNVPRNNWKPLFEVNFNKNSTTIFLVLHLLVFVLILRMRI